MNDFNFGVDIQIRMSDLDSFSHVNNGAQCNLFDFGRSAYFEHVFAEKIDWSLMDLVIVHLDIDFLHPLLFGDDVVCDSKVYEIGNKSMKMIQQLRVTNNNIVKTICKSVIVGFDRINQTSLPIKSAYREKITTFEHY